MTVKELLSTIEKMKKQNKINDNTKITTYDIWLNENENYELKDLKVDEPDNQLILF